MSIPTPYTSGQPVDDFGLTFSTIKFSAALALDTDTTLTIPGDARRYKMIITTVPDGVVYTALNTAAAAPAGGAFALTGSELIPAKGVMCREVKAGDVVHFFASGAIYPVTVALYSV